MGANTENLSRIPGFGRSVPRARLLQVIDETHPSLLVIESPAGYGKSILAAQVAVTDRFESAVWIDADGIDVGPRQLAAMLAARLGTEVPKSRGAVSAMLPVGLTEVESEELLHPALAPFAGRSLCVVIDDLGPLSDPTALEWLFRELSITTSSDVCLVVTTRTPTTVAGLSDTLLLQPDDLRLSIDEARIHFEMLYGSEFDEDVFERCFVSSAGHIALFVVLARTARLRRGVQPQLTEAGSEQLTRHLEMLASSQLTMQQQEALLAASLLRRGTRVDLETVLDYRLSSDDLQRIAECIPLFRLGTLAGCLEFRVHDMGRLAYAARAKRQPQGAALVVRAVRRLAESEQFGDAFELVAELCGPEETADFLQDYGSSLADSGAIGLLQTVIDKVPTSVLVHRPSLLLLQARALRLLGNEAEALRRTRLVADLADNSGDLAVRLEALMLLGRAELSMGRAGEARRILETVLAESGDALPADAVELVRAHLAASLVHSGDSTDAERFIEMAEQSRARLQQSSASTYCDMLYAYCLFVGSGRCDTGVVMSARARAQASPVELRIPALLNSANALALRGDFSRADALVGQARLLLQECGTEAGACGCATTLAVIAAGRGDLAEAERLMSEAERRAVDDYDLFSALTSRSCWRRAFGDAESALADSEQAREFFLGFEHMPLLWEAGIESCANLLALGDGAESELRARELEKEVAAVRAEGLALRARLLRAECLRRKGRSDRAQQMIERSAEYLVSGNSNWHTAMYTGAFPGLLGIIATVVGEDRVPARLLRAIPSVEQAVQVAAESLGNDDWHQLVGRMKAMPGGIRLTAEPAKPHCTVRLFGGLRVETSDGIVADADWRKRKARLLFTMLVVRKGKDVPREQLLEYLWPDMDAERARSNFYVVWNNMKRALSPNLEKGTASPFIRAAGGVCRVDDVLVSSDLDEFEQCLLEARRAESEGDRAKALAAYRRLSDLYGGDLLPGDIYDDWFAPLRERCRQEFSDSMLRAAIILEQDGDPASALQLLRQALAHDAWREDLYQMILRCQIACGQRSAAIDTYMACMQRLSEDLGLDPSAETKRLYAQVLAMEEPATGEYLS